jgi:hypothetical protein
MNVENLQSKWVDGNVLILTAELPKLTAESESKLKDENAVKQIKIEHE